mmetsp:Transcript_27379/g.68560  ORF Transcript_27379/g.68560 Transcript_27379/m.68560 type:complete len:200 (-) Transcript_27379:297-896(-)
MLRHTAACAATSARSACRRVAMASPWPLVGCVPLRCFALPDESPSPPLELPPAPTSMPPPMPPRSPPPPLPPPLSTASDPPAPGREVGAGQSKIPGRRSRCSASLPKLSASSSAGSAKEAMHSSMRAMSSARSPAVLLPSAPSSPRSCQSGDVTRQFVSSSSIGAAPAVSVAPAPAPPSPGARLPEDSPPSTRRIKVFR